MNKQLALQTKEYLLEILNWSTDSNRKLAVQCIGEVAEEALQGLNEYLRAEEQQEQKKNDINWCTDCDHHFSKCRCPVETSTPYECDGSCKDCVPAPETKE